MTHGLYAAHFPATLTRRTGAGPPDVYGDPSDLEEEIPVRVMVWQVGAREDSAGRQTETEDWHVCFDRYYPCAGTDRVHVPEIAMTLELTGPPEHVLQQPFGIHHTECAARQVT